MNHSKLNKQNDDDEQFDLPMLQEWKRRIPYRSKSHRSVNRTVSDAFVKPCRKAGYIIDIHVDRCWMPFQAMQMLARAEENIKTDGRQIKWPPHDYTNRYLAFCEYVISEHSPTKWAEYKGQLLQMRDQPTEHLSTTRLFNAMRTTLKVGVHMD